jgi:tetratricopeptide (TPR) repeat protein
MDWSRVKAVFLAALEEAAEDRSAFLDRACEGSEELRREVESLLASDESAGSFCETPAAALLADGAAVEPTPPPRLQPGARVGAYEIIGFIAAGGMGDVYHARHTVLERVVALKSVRGEGGDPSAQRRLIREARHASILKHPGICTIHEVIESPGGPFIVMEYVDGRPLHEILRERALGVEEALSYGKQIAAAVHHAHEHGVVHRDLKSSNVMVDASGHAMVLDFGLAVRLPGAGDAESAQSTLTQLGVLAGTLSHMAPELLLGREADERSDVWALGVLLFEMATGALPFRGRTPYETTSAILSEPTPPIDGRVPPQLGLVVERCLMKEPDARYQRASEVAFALDAIRIGPPTANAPRAVPWRRALIPAVLLLALLLPAVRWVTRPERESVPPVARTSPVVVFPFSVQGAGDIGFLRQGMAELLSRSLDGVGDLQAVDPVTVSRLAAEAGAPGTLDPERARAIAQRLQAAHYVVGSLAESGGRLRAYAALHDTGRSDGPVVEASVQGDAADLFGVVDQITAQLLSGRTGQVSARMNRTAALSTTSVAALKEYLRAEQSLRDADYSPAIAGFQRAVALDSTFALAYYRLAVAGGLLDREPNMSILAVEDAAPTALDRALAHAHRLSEHDRRLLEGYAAFRLGKADQAEQTYRAILRDYPDDLEARFQLAEVLFRYNALRGRPPAEAREHYDGVLAVDPEFLCPI